MINFNTEPYNDDYDENKKFYRILYRPSFAVQARELTQMQTILQNQISRHGDAIFKQGARVIPGQAAVETVTQPNKGSDYVKLQPIYNGIAVQTFLSSLEGKTIIGSSGVTAQVFKVQDAQDTDPSTLYVRYTTTGNDNTTKTFSNSEVIHTEDGTHYFQAADSDAVGKGSLATIQRGVYYINKHFCLVEAQSIVLEKYSNTPSYRVGLLVTEQLVTPEADETLLDNAQNSYNYAAPGAHRYFIDLTLVKLPINSTTDTNFIELIRVSNGNIKSVVEESQYSLLGEELARRTMDESGDYTVREFGIDVREHRNNDRGQWLPNTAYITGDIVTNAGNFYVAKNTGTSVTTAPVHTSSVSVYDGLNGIKWEYTTNPVYNRGIYADGDAGLLAIGLEPGKAYVNGWEIQKDSTTYLDVPKARDYAQATNSIIQPTVGNYVLVTNVNNLPPLNTLSTISLRRNITGTSVGTAQGAEIGTARVRMMEWHGGTSSGSGAIYKLSLFDVQMSTGYSFNRDVKSFFYAGSSAYLSFSADISPVLYQLPNSSVTSSSTTVTGTGTAFLTDLKVGDLVLIGDSNYRRVTAITDNGTLTIDATLSVSVGVPIKRCTTEILEPTNTSLIFPLANYAIRSMRGAGNSGVNNTTYTCYQKIDQTASGTTLSLSTSGTFGSASGATNYIVVDNHNGTNGGAVVSPVSISPTGSTCVITLPSAQSGHEMTVIAAVTRNGSGYEKTKTLKQITETFTTAALAQQAIIYLDKADVFRINSIKMDPSSAFGSSPSSSAYTLDISDRFDFDNGQRSTHYDWGSLKLKPSFAAPSNPVQVTYEYFEHGIGDYFDVNSYNGIDYSEIPPILRDSLDFRPRVADKSSGSTKNFVSTNGSISGLPKRGENISSDYNYYLARKDKIAIDKNGKFFDITGVPSVTPGDPADPSLGMVLYNIALEPYTFSTSTTSVVVNKVENKRYTMRDIGKLESRINTLEYYTSLSLLEQETQSLKITDSTGMDRMKNGFIVDNFTGNKISDGSSVDNFNSIDTENNVLRPFYTLHNVNLLEKNSNKSQRDSAKYELHGDIITLPIIDTPVLVKQEYASRLENINPFAIYTFLGNININPPSDDWFETKRLPDYTVKTVEGDYNVLKQLAEKAGILGTVWGAWKPEWIGVPVSKGTQTLTNSNTSRAKLNSIGGDWSSNGGNNLRSITVENFATPVGQSRTGIRTSIGVKTDYEVVADRVVSSAVIPYIRSRNILVQVKSLKPTTRFYAYFDDIDVNDYITPSTKLVYTANSGVFDTTTNVGGSASEAKRRIGGDSQICLNRGDVITNNTNTASAVVVGKYVDPDTGALTLDLQNVIGTFTAGDTFTGSVSSASGTVVSISTPANLVTNASGDVSFIFNIPQTDAIRFRTGARELKLIDSATSTGQWTSRGRGIYRAEGVLETKQRDVNAVRNAEIVKEMVGPNDDPAARQTIYQTSQKVLSDTGWYDPLAQSFLVEQKGGAFLTGIDVFFASKDTSIPVSLEIRNMVNGAPGKNVLAFSHTVLNPDQVNLSSTLVTLDGTDYPSYDTPTRFTFSSPVYVENNTEYCFVLQSDSNNYKVWISNMGDTIPGSSGRTISTQPYAGVLFKSQNASTWTPDQNQDMKFTIYRAKFDTTAVGSVDFVNDVLPKDTLETDPIQTVSGTNTVRVWHYDHGMYVGSKVTISNVTSSVNGIPAAEFNGDHTIVTADANCYTFATSTSATSSGYSGGSAVKATRNVTYDAINPSVQMQTFSDTSCSFNIKTTSGKSVDGSQNPYIADSVVTPCLVKEDTYFYSPRVIASEINEANSALAGAKSLTFTALLSTTNDAVSPVIDTARASVIAISNSINSPTESNTNVAALDTKVIFTGSTGAYTFTSTGFTSTNSTVRGLMASIGIGRYITLAGSSNAGNTGTYLVTGFTDDGTTATITLGGFTGTSEAVSSSGITVSLRELFFDEIAPVGSSSISKYVTTPVKFGFTSTYLKVRFTANIPNEASVALYYKTSLGDTTQMKTAKYTLANPDSTITKVDNGNTQFYDVEYSLSGLTPFDGVTVKLVMNSTNSSAVPVIKDLRIIACP